MHLDVPPGGCDRFHNSLTIYIYMFLFYEIPVSFWLYHSRRDVTYNGIFRSDEVNVSIRKKIECVEKDNAF